MRRFHRLVSRRDAPLRTSSVGVRSVRPIAALLLAALLAVGLGGRYGGPALGLARESRAEALCPAAATTDVSAARGIHAVSVHVPYDEPPSLPDVPRIAAACQTDNPYLITACYQTVYQEHPTLDWPAIVIFRDTPDDEPVFMAAAFSQVGTVWGLAYSESEHAVYAAAFHKRMSDFGPGGPGAIYRVDLSTRQVSELARLDAGPSEHSAFGAGDTLAMNTAFKTSLGDIDLDDDEDELYVANLYDRRIYRLEVPSGRVRGSFAHGAAGEDWALEARPFGLKFHEGRLYHGVVQSAQLSRDPFAMWAYVYSSAPDGSDMRLVASVQLIYDRGEARLLPVVTWHEPVVHAPLDWLPWKDGYNSLVHGKGVMSVWPQPIVSDIEFDADGHMAVGMRDRVGEMTLSYQDVRMEEATIQKPGLGVGDLLRAIRDGGGWSFVGGEFFYDRITSTDESLLGGLAAIPRGDRIVSGAIAMDGRAAAGSPTGFTEGAMWYRAGTGSRTAWEDVCTPILFETGDLQPKPWPPFVPPPVSTPTPLPTTTPLAARPRDVSNLAPEVPERPQHNEWIPSRSLGDIERLCGAMPTWTPTPGPSPTPSPSPTPTATPSITSSPPPTETSTLTPTPGHWTIYLPLADRESCIRRRKPVDVTMVLDMSTSMYRPTREDRSKHDAALEAARLFIDQMELTPSASGASDRVAVVGFNETAWIEIGLTNDRVAVDAALDRLLAKIVEGTRLDLAIRRGQDAIEGPGRDPDRVPVMLLLTDGLPNRVPTPTPTGRQEDTVLAEAERAKERGTLIYTIGLGLPDDVFRKMLERAATRISMFYFAPDGEDLAEIYDQIAGELLDCP